MFSPLMFYKPTTKDRNLHRQMELLKIKLIKDGLTQEEIQQKLDEEINKLTPERRFALMSVTVQNLNILS